MAARRGSTSVLRARSGFSPDRRISYFLVGMRPLERSDHGFQAWLFTHQLKLVLDHCFDLTLIAKKRRTAIQWSELPLTSGLPGTTVVITNPAGTCLEHSRFYRSQMRFRHIKFNFIKCGRHG